MEDERINSTEVEKDEEHHWGGALGKDMGEQETKGRRGIISGEKILRKNYSKTAGK